MDGSYYSLLGVSPDATREEIKVAYRNRLKETHPDVNDSADASERTQELLKAKQVLTDPDERERYDSLGHAAYMARDEGTEGPNPSKTASDTATQHTSTTTEEKSKQKDQQADNRQSQTTTETVGGSASWYNRSDGHVGTPQWTEGGSDEWNPWTVNGSYAVRRSDNTFQSIIFSSKSLVLLAATFVVYPALIFGALFPAFPLPVRLLIGLCAVFVVAFLQSIPEVGIFVFGTWSIILPVVLLSMPISFVSPVGITILLAVLFPLGLSILTRVVIRPVRI